MNDNYERRKSNKLYLNKEKQCKSNQSSSTEYPSSSSLIAAINGQSNNGQRKQFKSRKVRNKLFNQLHNNQNDCPENEWANNYRPKIVNITGLAFDWSESDKSSNESQSDKSSNDSDLDSNLKG